MASESTVGYPARMEVDYPEECSRGLALLAVLMLKGFLLIPHFFLLAFLTAAAVITAYYSYWGVLFTGRYPRGVFDFSVGIQRWQLRLNAWYYGWTVRYPPFSQY